MPELPEIETVKLQLEKVLVGQVCQEIKILSDKVIKGKIDEIVGRKVQKIERKGKVLLINFGPGLDLGFHFKMTGQLIYEPLPRTGLHLVRSADRPKNNPVLGRIVGGHPTEDFVNKMPSKHTRAIFEFGKTSPPTPLLNSGEGGSNFLYFNDQRMFGWIMLNPGFVDKLGPEPFEIEETKFIKILSKLRRPIKLAIMDQEVISGVGNIYANDALWEARIDPRTPVNQLSVDQLTSLFEKIKLVLKEGIKYGGATAADAKYIDLHGLGGRYQEHFRVYDREGQKCHRGDGVIHKFVLGGRGTYYCPKCQV